MPAREPEQNVLIPVEFGGDPCDFPRAFAMRVVTRRSILVEGVGTLNDKTFVVNRLDAFGKPSRCFGGMKTEREKAKSQSGL